MDINNQTLALEILELNKTYQKLNNNLIHLNKNYVLFARTIYTPQNPEIQKLKLELDQTKNKINNILKLRDQKLAQIKNNNNNNQI